jgi:hypothetical protein
VRKTRWIVEQINGILKRKFGIERASYFPAVKIHARAVLKRVCQNLLKAVNKIEKMELLEESVRLLQGRWAKRGAKRPKAGVSRDRTLLVRSKTHR